MKLILPLPPSLNEMIDLAKQRDFKGRSTIYSSAKHEYGTLCDVASREMRIFPPREPWRTWVILEAHFYLYNPRDPVELMAGLKWPVDWLVKRGFVVNDSSRELLDIPHPAMTVDRKTKQRLEMEVHGWPSEGS